MCLCEMGLDWSIYLLYKTSTKSAYSILRQTSKMEGFSKNVNVLVVNCFHKCSILDVLQGSQYASASEEYISEFLQDITLTDRETTSTS